MIYTLYKAGDLSISTEFEWIGDWAGRRAVLTPNREALFDNIEKKLYTFNDLNLRANKLARVLLDEGITKGDRVAMFSTNRLECIDLFLATGKIGAILVPFNIRLSISELEYLVKKTSPSIFFYEPRLKEKAQEIKKMELVKNNIVMGTKSILDDDTI
ncbi:MAG: AMP-binding protein, partial [Candidatus Hermodarchaeota archaeon]